MFAFTLVACDEGVSPAPRIQSLSFSREEAHLDAPASFSAAELFGLRVDAEPGASTDVRWTSSDTIAAPIDATGLLHSCGAASSVTITAIAKADTTKRATARAIIREPAPRMAEITSITDMQTGLPVDASTLRNSVRFNYSVSRRWAECSAFALVELAVVPARGGDPVFAARTGFTGGGDFVGTAGWLTRLVENGPYVLWLRLLIANRTAPLPLASMPAEIRN